MLGEKISANLVGRFAGGSEEAGGLIAAIKKAVSVLAEAIGLKISTKENDPQMEGTE